MPTCSFLIMLLLTLILTGNVHFFNINVQGKVYIYSSPFILSQFLITFQINQNSALA